MPTHWHFVVWPRRDGELSAFFRWLAHTHAMRWRVSHRAAGYGPVYQGRFKSFAVQKNEHLLTVQRYVECNALTAGLVKRAQDWSLSSLWGRDYRASEVNELLSDCPVDLPRKWIVHVNEPLTANELERITTSELVHARMVRIAGSVKPFRI